MPRRNPLLLPIAVLLAVVIVGVAAFIVLRRTETTDRNAAKDGSPTANMSDIRGIQNADHVLGNPTAPIVFVVYSDFECPFCKQFHETMHRIVEEFGKDGSVAVVFRQFPLVQLHDQAPTEALASECVADIGGNEAFWKFADELYRVTPSNNNFELTQLPVIAESAGVSRAQFEACMRSSNLMSNVQRDFNEAVAAGALGTPFTVMLAAGEQIKFGDAQSYVAMRAVVETALKQVKHGSALIPPEGAIAPTPMPLTEERGDDAEQTAPDVGTSTPAITEGSTNL